MALVSFSNLKYPSPTPNVFLFDKWKFQLSLYILIVAQPSSLKKYKEGLAEEEFQTPAYFFQMNSCQVEEGRLARFDCRVVAHPKPEITW